MINFNRSKLVIRNPTVKLRSQVTVWHTILKAPCATQILKISARELANAKCAYSKKLYAVEAKTPIFVETSARTVRIKLLGAHRINRIF